MTGYQVSYILCFILMLGLAASFYYYIGAKKTAAIANGLVLGYGIAFMSEWIITNSYWDTVTSLFWINFPVFTLITTVVMSSLVRELSGNGTKLELIDEPPYLTKLEA